MLDSRARAPGHLGFCRRTPHYGGPTLLDGCEDSTRATPQHAYGACVLAFSCYKT